jgi:hypothetical protein
MIELRSSDTVLPLFKFLLLKTGGLKLVLTRHLERENNWG